MQLPSPVLMGAPSRYTEWRHGQDRALERALLSPKRFVVLALPTGIGKSLVVTTLSGFTGARSVALTSTKGLQDQYARDFGETGLVDVRGMNNYPCLVLDGGMCDEGPCLDGERCHLRDRGCLYFEAVKSAKAAKHTVTNYAFWMTQRQRGDGFANVEMLILDEAHEAADEVSGFLRVSLSSVDLALPQEQLDIDQWRRWAKAELFKARRREQVTSGATKRRAREVVSRLERLSLSTGPWVIEKTRSGWAFEPLWPREHAGPLLWGEIPKVVMASATIRPSTMERLGVAPADYDWIEVGSPIPVRNRPILHVPTVRLNARAGEGELGTWVDRIDQIIEGRLDRKGIIHTVSYERADFLMRKSQYRGIMLSHDSKNARAVVEEFKKAPAPALLVSPSVHTGYDFPYDAARYQIIGKVPFPDGRSALVKARSAVDQRYQTEVAITKLVQMVGRIVRGPQDWGETFITDDTVRMIYGHKELLPGWFLDAFKTVKSVPPALELPAAA